MLQKIITHALPKSKTICSFRLKSTECKKELKEPSQCAAMKESDKSLKELLKSQIAVEQEKIKKFRKEHGNAEVGKVTVDMIYGGMRGITGLICETSTLDPDEGIKFRGYSIPDCQKLLPAADDGCEPLAEGIFWLLLTGCIPSKKQVKKLTQDWVQRSKVPDEILSLLKSLSCGVHPMAQLSAAITVSSKQSKFAKAYHDSVHKTKYWEYTFEDAMDVIAQLPVIAGNIYQNTFKGGKIRSERMQANLDWGGNYAKMLGFDMKQFSELIRMYLVIHSDHEGGNVSAHTTHLVGSALSDPYLSLAAGLNGLAGPLHGLANQECLIWLEKIRQKYGNDTTEDQIKQFVEETLKAGVVPGYGHAVLRKTDPRFTVLKEFAEKHAPDDALCKLVAKVYKVVPPMLQKLGKVKNPFPNVDAHSGALLQHYGLKEMNYYTVPFGVSRALGVMSSLIWDRALGLPIERPKSVSTEALLKRFSKK